MVKGVVGVALAHTSLFVGITVSYESLVVGIQSRSESHTSAKSFENEVLNHRVLASFNERLTRSQSTCRITGTIFSSRGHPSDDQ